MTDLLFVYGTLRGGSGHPMHQVLAAAARRLGAASVAGTLYRFDGFPGLVLAHGHACARVHGCVWTLHERAVLRELDDFEGQEFERQTISVTTHDDRVLEPFAYVYVASVEGRDIVQGGNWLGP